MIDIQASVESLLADQHVGDHGILKHPDDLARYEAVIAATRPEVIVETGTCHGGSALWFEQHGIDVITIDNHPLAGDRTRRLCKRVTWILGDSADPAVVRQVAALTAGRRTMVVLDSDHSGAHVGAEILAYGGLVTPGCYLVVEDGIFRYTPLEVTTDHLGAGCAGTPLDAVDELLVGNADWVHDDRIENLRPITHHPGGWWRRKEADGV